MVRFREQMRTVAVRPIGGREWLCLLLLFIGMNALLPAVIPAAEARERKAEATMRESTWKALREALDALEAGREAEAAERLQSLVPTTRDHPFEHAVVRQAEGHLLLQQDRPREALDAFRAALAAENLPAEVIREIRQHVARIHIVLEEFDAALAELDRLPEAPPDAEALLLRGHALFKLERWQPAAKALERALRASPAPPVAWRELLLAAWLHAEALPQAAAVLKDLIAAEPEHGDWWRQLASIYQRLGAHRAAAAVLVSANRLGLLDPRDLLELARLLLYTEQPERAARLLAEAHGQGRFQAMEDEALLLLADAYALGREPQRAIAFLEPAAAGGSRALLARLGRLQFNEGQWDAAWRTLKRAADEGPADGGSTAQAEDALLAGIAALQAGERKAATSLLRRAERDASTRERARRWLARGSADG